MLYKIWWLFQTVFFRAVFKKVGLKSYVAKPTFVYGGRRIIIENEVRIFPGLRAETHKGGTIIIKQNTSIGQNFHIISSAETVQIGEGTTISGNVFITNTDHDYQQIGQHILEQNYIVKTTAIGANCFIGYGAALQAGTILGKQCVVGANSVVRGHYPDYSVIAGAPARVIKRYNESTKLWEKTDDQGNFIK